MPDVFPPGFGGTATAGSLTASQTEEATECYKSLAPYNATLLEAVREYIAQHVRRSASVSIKTAGENFIVKRECLGKNPMLSMDAPKANEIGERPVADLVPVAA